MSKTVLVTGGAGFIGSHTVEGLIAEGLYDVRVLDNFATGHRHNIAPLAGSIELFEGDIRDMETVEEAVKGVDAVIHLAALPSVPRSVKAPVTSNDVNAGGTLKLLSAAHRAGVSRVILASSSSVYGANPVLPKSEDMLPAPVSPYAASKLAAEHYIGVFARTYGMDTLSIRYFNVFGPRQDPHSQYSGVVAKFMLDALHGDTCTVYGDGTQSRDFTYVDNVVAANLSALVANGLHGQAVNVACGAASTVNDLVEAISTALGSVVKTQYVESRSADVPHSQADIERAARLLDYSPRIAFQEGIRRTLAWYRDPANTR
ncbi:MAG: SDR family oxidoreductase [Actinobacteria bacterium]|nr:SDR family oxidoreductase [Actinomycetota bacterium]